MSLSSNISLALPASTCLAIDVPLVPYVDMLYDHTERHFITRSVSYTNQTQHTQCVRVSVYVYVSVCGCLSMSV